MVNMEVFCVKIIGEKQCMSSLLPRNSVQLSINIAYKTDVYDVHVPVNIMVAIHVFSWRHSLRKEENVNEYMVFYFIDLLCFLHVVVIFHGIKQIMIAPQQ